MAREIYNSTTLGPIPLSFTGRHLLQELRTCIQDAIKDKDFNTNGDALSRIRGRIAQYMSKLEGKDEVRIEYRAAMDSRTAHLAGVADLKRRYDHRCEASFDNIQNFGGFRPGDLPPRNPFEVLPDPPKPVNQIVLPPIPKGYELNMVGGITTISPIEKKARGK